MWLLLALSCASPDDTDPGSGDSDVEGDADTDTDTDTDADTDTEDPTPEDVDQDGSYTPADCDDYDPAVHPGATEVWNGEDDDCDGRSDADGEYSGMHAVDASAVYEGDTYRFELDCPTTLTRSGRSFSFEVVCTPDPDDPMAQLLLGSTLTITEKENVIEGADWDGSVVVSSSSGWDTDGSGQLRWSGFDAVVLSTSMSSFSLETSGRGTLGAL